MGVYMISHPPISEIKSRAGDEMTSKVSPGNHRMCFTSIKKVEII